MVSLSTLSAALVIALLLSFGTGTDLLALIGVAAGDPLCGHHPDSRLKYTEAVTFSMTCWRGINDIRTGNKPVTWGEASMGHEEEPEPDIGYDNDGVV